MIRSHHIDGTAARQLDLVDDLHQIVFPRRPLARPAPTLRLLTKDVYAELTRRRRRAQIAARRFVS